MDVVVNPAILHSQQEVGPGERVRVQPSGIRI